MHKGRTLTDMQILGCELNQNAFGGRAPPGPTVRAIVLPDLLAVIRGRGGRGRERKGLGIGKGRQC